METNVQQLSMSRETWGDNKGLMLGYMVIETEEGSVTIRLEPAVASAILNSALDLLQHKVNALTKELKGYKVLPAIAALEHKPEAA